MSESEKLDRHTDPSGLVESARAATDGRPFLGSFPDVERILRGFAGEVITRYDEVGSGTLTPSDAANADRAECQRLAAAFCGQDESYAPSRGWSGTVLADHLRTRMELVLQPEEDDAQLVAQAFAVFVHNLYDLMREVSAGAPEAEVQATLTGYVRTFSLALLGVDGND